MVENAVPAVLEEYAPAHLHPEQWDLTGLRSRLQMDYMLTADRLAGAEGGEIDFESRADLEAYLQERAKEQYDRKMEQFGENSDAVLRFIVLSTIDEKWKDHLYDLDHLKASIGFRGWGQKDPLVEYKREAYDMFVDLMRDIQLSVARFFFRAQLAPSAPPPPLPEFFGTPNRREEPETGPPSGRRSAARMGVNPSAAISRAPLAGTMTTNRGEPASAAAATAVKEVGRNDPCPCGSGKKYKQCHGKA
jgi:preprotein translocase subunit SecA